MAVLDQRRTAADGEDGQESRGRADRGVRRPARRICLENRPQFYKDITLPFYGYNRPGAKISEGIRDKWWLQGMMGGMKAGYDCIKAFSETDFTEDLKKFDVPTLILHGEDDQIVPIGAAALQSCKAREGCDA